MTSSKKLTMAQALEFAAKEIKAANLRNAGPVEPAREILIVHVRRTFSIEGSISVSFRLVRDEHRGLLPQPVVTANFPACNKGVVELAAFQALVNEIVPLAASIQAQLDEFEMATP